MNKRLLALFGALVVVGVTVGVLAAPLIPQIGGGSSAEWPDIYSARQLIEESDRIIVGQFIGDTSHVIPSMSPVTGNNTGAVTEVYRKFDIIESLKGDAVAGGTIHVVFTKRTVIKDTSVGTIDYTFEIASMAKGDSYVLFLEGVPRPADYPAQYGDTVWVIPGEPGIARADPNGTLLFEASERYRSENGTSGAPSAAPFTLTKDEIMQQGNSAR